MGAYAQEVIKVYSEVIGLEAAVEFHFVDDIESAWWDYIDEPIFEDLSKYDGYCVADKGNFYHLFIRNDCLDLGATILHEYVHAVDFERFRIEFNNGDNVKLHKQYPSLSIFTEFNAYMYSFAVSIYIKEENWSEHFVEQKLKIIERLKQLENDITTDYKPYFYELVRLLAEIRVWQMRGFDVGDILENEFAPLYKVLVKLTECWSEENFGLLQSEVNKIKEFLDEKFDNLLSTFRNKK